MLKTRIDYVRLAYRAALVLFFIVVLPYFLEHAYWMILGQATLFMMKSRWDLVLVNVALFLFFILILPYRQKKNWRSKGIYSAFIIALFAEMYGFPLTTYLLLSNVGAAAVQQPASLITFNILGTGFAMPAMMVAGSLLTIVGILLVIFGWYHIYKHKGKLVKTGLYSVIRHPQYTGIIFIITGWILHWPTIPTLLMWPILVWTYYRLALKEEADLQKAFGKKFVEYRASVPGFI